MTEYSEAVETARTYYNSDDADNFYATIWGGEDIHVGLYEKEVGDIIFDASHHTVVKLASMLNLDSSKKVLDIGAGYGGTARYLVKTTGCYADCLNLSEIQNERNRHLNQEQSLTDKINVIDGNFEAIPAEANQYDVIVSQDAILHSGQRDKVLQEVERVLKPGGEFIFTDPMQSDDCPAGVLQPVLDRIHLETLGSISFYQQQLEKLGFIKLDIVSMPHQLVNHYSHVLAEIQSRESELVKVCTQEYVDRMKIGLQHWIDAGKNNYLAWGILHFRKAV